jgi:hypothetical protein
MRLVVTDEVHSVADGRVLELERTYDEISAGLEGSFESERVSGSATSTGSCEVEGSTVTFRWNGDEGLYEATGEELDDDVLEELVFDLDCTALLPNDAVTEGDEWTIDPEDFQDMLDPWDQLPWTWASSSEVPPAEGEVEPDVEVAESEGGVTAVFEGLRTEGGVQVAVIALDGTIEVDRNTDMSHEDGYGLVEGHTESRETLEVAGKALWNVTEGRLRSLEVEVGFSAESSLRSVFQGGGQEFEMEVESTTEGTRRLTVSIEEREQ